MILIITKNLKANRTPMSFYKSTSIYFLSVKIPKYLMKYDMPELYIHYTLFNRNLLA